MGLSLALDQGVSVLKASGLPFTTRLEVETGVNDGYPYWQALTVQPLWHDRAEQYHLFTQLSWRHPSNEGDTYNTGLALRRLSEDKKSVAGANVFFDHAAERNHNRVSVGVDYQTTTMGVSANRYIPLSDWRTVDRVWEERASQGWDLELQGRHPDFPAWQTSLRGYQWSGNDEGSRDKVYGYEAGLEWTPMNIITVRAAVQDEQDESPSLEAALRLNYRFGESIETLFDKPVTPGDATPLVYAKVRRENEVRTERRRKDEALLTVIESNGANTAQTATGNVTLQAGARLALPATITVSSAGGSVARLRFANGAVLSVGTGSTVQITLDQIMLLSGTLQFISGAGPIALAAPGATIDLQGTDVDLRTAGGVTTLRVRDGRAAITGTVSGTVTLDPGEMGQANAGVVGTVAPGSATYIAHGDAVSVGIDRNGSPLITEKAAPYPSNVPYVMQDATMPGQTLQIGLPFNIAVTAAAGPPRLTLDIGGVLRTANLTGGSGTKELTFSYTLLPADGGQSQVTVTGLDENGATITGNGVKQAVTTIADAELNLSGAVTDVIAPSGYAVAFTTDPIGATNQGAASFQITGAEVGTTFAYSVSSDGGGAPATGSGTIATATQNVTGLDLSSLSDGTLTVSLTLTDAAANTGAAVTDTVTKDVVALGLDFVGGDYELAGTSYASPASIPGWSFSRAAPATTYAEDSSGNLVAFAANQPRITDKGILIEGSRTNLILRSQEIEDGVWAKSGATVLANVATAPDGSFTADQISLPTASASQIYQAVSANASPLTCSIWIRSDVPVSIRVGFYDSVADVQTVDVTGTWQRISKVRPSGFTSADRRACWIYSLSPNTILYTWGAQLEQAEFASSYIPTLGSAVTRSADSARIDGLALGGAPVTMLAEWLHPSYALSQNIAVAALADSVGENSNRVSLRTIYGDNSIVTSGGVSVAAIQRGGPPLGNNVAISGIRVASGAANTRIYTNGVGGTAVTANVPVSLDRLWLGRTENFENLFISTYLRRVQIYESGKSDAQLQALTQ